MVASRRRVVYVTSATKPVDAAAIHIRLRGPTQLYKSPLEGRYGAAMTAWQIFFAVIGACIGAPSLIMAFARTPPQDAVANLSKWAGFFGISIPAWMRRSEFIVSARRWARRVLFLLFLLGALAFVKWYWQSTPQESGATSQPKPSITTGNCNTKIGGNNNGSIINKC
jgi:hypothetical protein